MRSLDDKDRMHFHAAEGWLELGDHFAANEELERISPQFRAHPAVLELRAKVFAAGKKWDGVFTIAKILAEQLPDRPHGWLLLAQAKHAMGNTESAYQMLFAVGEQFAELSAITYTLGVYATLTGRWIEAEDWLARAFDLGGAKLKLKALDDPDLSSFWERMGRDCA